MCYYIRIYLSVFFLLILSYGFTQESLPWIQVEGSKLVNELGEQMVFQGLNASDPDKLEKAGHWNEAYFSEMKNWGANLVRFPVHPRAWRELGKDDYLKLLDAGIQMASETGLYVIIDWHSIGNLRSELFQSPGYITTKAETYDFWRTMALRYGDNSAVAFFELFNEPTTASGRFGLCTWPQWKEIVEELIVIIRANGGKNIPLVSGFNWAYDLADIKDDPVKFTDVAYVSHPYPQKRPQPWIEQWEEDWGYVADKYPVVLTEVGFCGAEARGAHIPVISDPSYVDVLTEYCHKKDVSYVVWVFDPNWSPMLIEDWTFEPTEAGKKWKEIMMKK